MQTNEHLVLCGGMDEPQVARGQSLRLDLHGKSPNVRLQISDISRRLLANASGRSRRSSGSRQLRLRRRQRDFAWGKDRCANGKGVASKIQVRDSSSPAQTSGLPILSCPRSSRRWASFPMTATSSSSGRPSMHRSWQKYFEFKGKAETAFTPDEVILFSGGLDSLSGTVEKLVGSGKKCCARKPSFCKQDGCSAERPCGQAMQTVRQRPYAPCSRLGESRW